VQVQIGRRSARENEAYVQPITVRNTSAHAIGGPFEIAVDNLTSGVTPANPTGAASCAEPAGNPVMRAADAPLWLLPGASFSTTLRIKTSTMQGLKVRVLAGQAAPSSR